jgi:hypothetical protein
LSRGFGLPPRPCTRTCSAEFTVDFVWLARSADFSLRDQQPRDVQMNMRRYILSSAGQPPTREQLAEASVLLVALRCFYQAYNGWPFWQYIASGFSCPIGVCPAQPFPLKHVFTAWTVAFDPSAYHNFAHARALAYPPSVSRGCQNQLWWLNLVNACSCLVSVSPGRSHSVQVLLTLGSG